MENQTFSDDLLFLENLRIPPQASIPAFILLLLIYVFILVSNLGLVVLVWMEQSLRQPMYLLLCNMSINDVFGATIIVPQLLRDLLWRGADRLILYSDCVVQAFCVHLHASASHTVLLILAFDRYQAICSPLHYASTMSHKAVASLSAGAWGSAAVLVLILVGLSVRLSRCRRVVSHLFCDNASLFKLSCESLLANQVYGLTFTVLLLGASVCGVTLTYLRIAIVCIRSGTQTLNLRALQTCTTHLAVYAALLGSALVIVILHRFPGLQEHRKVAAMLGHVALPALNTVIYGLQISEVRQRLAGLIRIRKTGI